MASDWEEVKRLAADFQRAQLSSTVQKLSERNCVEIVKKLIELKLIDVIFTTDGKEYLTPQRLLKEIKDELIVHGGRINLVELAQNINVDFSHIESKANEFARSESDVRIVLGQLVTSEYLDHLAEEVNEKLDQCGQITVGELTKQYDLPGDFLEEAIHKRLGILIQAQADSSDPRTFFTDSYVKQHRAKIQGVLSAVTRPVAVSNLMNHFKFPEKLFYSVCDELLKTGRLAGCLTSGRSDKALFIPDLYAKAQNEWVDSFYKQNGYLEYDSVARLGIQDPKSYILKRYKNEPLTFLSSCCVGKSILNQVESSIEEALNSKSWIDIMPLLPSVFNSEDCEKMILTVAQNLSKQKVTLRMYCNSIVVSDELFQACQNSFDDLMNAKAEEDIAKNPHLFVASQLAVKSSSSKRDEASGKKKPEKKEDRKKKTGGKYGGGTQGRETKMKAVKKKYMTGKGDADSESEEEVTTKPLKQSEVEFLEIQEIKNHLQKLSDLKDCSSDLLSELAVEMHGPLTKKYQEVARTLYAASIISSGASRKKQHSEYQEKLNSLLNHISVFEKGFSVFGEELAAQLEKYLLKTLCTDVVNMIVSYLAAERGLTSAVDLKTETAPEVRQKVIEKLPDDLRQPLLKLHSSLAAKTIEDFEKNIENALSICDVMVKKVDKKKERLILANHRQSLIAQLEETNDAALSLHLAVLLIFQTQTHNMLHASGKFVPQMISYLQKHVPSDIYQPLSILQECIIKKKSSKDEEELDVDSVLSDMLPKVKEIAVTYRKSVCESEN